MALHFKLCGSVCELRSGNYRTKAITVMVGHTNNSLRVSRLFCMSGYWSSGTRLADSASVSGDGIETGDLPEFMVRTSRFSVLPI